MHRSRLRPRLVPGLLLLAGLAAAPAQPARAADTAEGLQSPRASERLEAAERLAAQGDRSAALVEAAAGILADTSAEPDERQRAAQVLASVGEPAVARLVQLLEAAPAAGDETEPAGHPRTGDLAAAVLAAIGPPGALPAVPALMARLERSRTVFLGDSTAAALARLAPADPSIRPRMRTWIEQDRNWTLRELGLQVLRALEPPEEAAADALALLQRDDPSLRSSLLHLLTNLQVPAATLAPELLRLHAAPEAEVRRAAVHALCSLARRDPAQSDPFVLALGERLEDPHVGTRAAALLCLVESKRAPSDAAERLAAILVAGDTPDTHSEVSAQLQSRADAATALARALSAAGDPDARGRLLDALGALGPRAGKAVPALVQAFETAAPGERETIGSVLTRVAPGTEQHLAVLRRLLEDPDTNYRWRVALSLGSVPPEAADGAILELLLQTLGDPHHSPRGGAAEALGKLRLQPARAVPALLERLVLASERIELDTLCEAIARFGADTVPHLRAALSGSMSEATALRYVRVLGELGPAAAPLARELALALGALERSEIAEALGKLGPAAAAEAEPALLRALRSADLHVRREAAWALGQVATDSAEAARALLALLETEQNRLVRMSAIGALGILAEELDRTVPALVKLLEADPDSSVRERAAEALGWLGAAGRPAVKPLLAAARDGSSTGLQVRAIVALTAVAPEDESVAGALDELAAGAGSYLGSHLEQFRGAHEVHARLLPQVRGFLGDVDAGRLDEAVERTVYDAASRDAWVEELRDFWQFRRARLGPPAGAAELVDGRSLPDRSPHAWELALRLPYETAALEASFTLARQAGAWKIESFSAAVPEEHQPPAPADRAALEEMAGVFVSDYENGDFRALYGRLSPGLRLKYSFEQVREMFGGFLAQFGPTQSRTVERTDEPAATRVLVKAGFARGTGSIEVRYAWRNGAWKLDTFNLNGEFQPTEANLQALQSRTETLWRHLGAGEFEAFHALLAPPLQGEAPLEQLRPALEAAQQRYGALVRIEAGEFEQPDDETVVIRQTARFEKDAAAVTTSFAWVEGLWHLNGFDLEPLAGGEPEPPAESP